MLLRLYTILFWYNMIFLDYSANSFCRVTGLPSIFLRLLYHVTYEECPSKSEVQIYFMNMHTLINTYINKYISIPYNQLN